MTSLFPLLLSIPFTYQSLWQKVGTSYLLNKLHRLEGSLQMTNGYQREPMTELERVIPNILQSKSCVSHNQGTYFLYYLTLYF